MHNLAVIPARGGSKRIPHKNIRNFQGQPLIAYSVRACQNSGLFDRIIVSTDDLEIASVAKELGAEVPFMRSKELSDDFTGTGAVTKDAYLQMLKLGYQADLICCVYATAPLLTGEWLKKACAKFLEDHADYLYACCEFPFPIQRAQYLKEDGTPVPVMPECMPMRSQDLEKTYQDAGLFYFYSPRFLDNREDLPEDTFIRRGFEMPRYRVIDIDTPEDFEYAQALALAVNKLGFV